MRAVLAISTVVATSASILFLACSSDTPAADASGDGGGTSSGGTSSGTLGGGTSSGGTSSGTLADGGKGPVHAQNGCLLYTTGLKSGAKVENIPKAGAIDWQNVSAAVKIDGQVATVVLNDGQESAQIHVSDFGFAVPAKAETWGIVVELVRQTKNPDGVLQTSYVNVDFPAKSPPVDPQFKFDVSTFFWPRLIMGTHDYGQENDTWGVDLYPADVNASSFGAKLSVKKAPDGGAGPITGTVDALTVAVWYADGDEKTCTR